MQIQLNPNQENDPTGNFPILNFIKENLLAKKRQKRNQ